MLPVAATATKRQDNHESYEEEHRIQALSKLGRLISLVVTSCRAARENRERDMTAINSRQHVSLDSMNHMVIHGLPEILTAACNGLPLFYPKIESVLESLLDPLEMMTRPKLLYHLEKWSPKSSSPAHRSSKNATESTVNIPIYADSQQRTSSTSTSRNMNRESYDLLQALNQEYQNQRPTDIAFNHPSNNAFNFIDSEVHGLRQLADEDEEEDEDEADQLHYESMMRELEHQDEVG